ncbi:MAG: hypothetical protein RLZZ511_293 [Cyanobacteriota bacterium]
MIFLEDNPILRLGFPTRPLGTFFQARSETEEDSGDHKSDGDRYFEFKVGSRFISTFRGRFKNFVVDVNRTAYRGFKFFKDYRRVFRIWSKSKIESVLAELSA